MESFRGAVAPTDHLIEAGTVTVAKAASMLGVSRSAAYRAIDARLAGDVDAWPTSVIRVGRTRRVPTAELLAVLGVLSAA